MGADRAAFEKAMEEIERGFPRSSSGRIERQWKLIEAYERAKEKKMIESCEEYESTEPCHYGMFPVSRPPVSRQFIPYQPMPELDNLRPRNLPPKSKLYA